MKVQLCVLVLFLAVFGLVNALFRRSASPQSRLYRPKTMSVTHSGPGSNALYLTDYIKKGQLEEARKLSQVVDIGMNKSYSGYFTVDDLFNSNMFFWFFPAQQAPATAPLILWLAGGPGTPSMFGLFVENGPLLIDESGKVHQRNATWNKAYHLLYIDNPVGTGFSFTNSSKGLSRNEDQVADNLYSALIQFFTVFNDYQKSDFYLIGESYAGKYIPALGYKIHQENPTAHLTINLVGMALGDPLIDPEHQIEGYSELMYQVGLATRSEADYVNSQTNLAITCIQEGNHTKATEILDKLMYGKLHPYPTYFFNMTGSNNLYNFLLPQVPAEFKYYIPFLNKDDVHTSIHVGRNAFQVDNNEVVAALLEDIFKSTRSNFTVLLDNYKVLVYNGQLDIIVGAALTENFLRQLKWSGQQNFLKAEKKIWMVDDDVAGYVRQVQTFQQVIVRKAGHLVLCDQPERAYAMIENFIGSC